MLGGLFELERLKPDVDVVEPLPNVLGYLWVPLAETEDLTGDTLQMCQRPRLLLRRDDHVDGAWSGDAWNPPRLNHRQEHDRLEAVEVGCAIGKPSESFENGVIQATALAHLADLANEYLSSYNGGTMGPLDNLVPGVYSTKASAFVPFNGIAVVKNVMSYQRRRKSGVGI